MIAQLGAVTVNPVSLVFVPKEGTTISVAKLPRTITVTGPLEVLVVKPFPKYPTIALFCLIPKTVEFHPSPKNQSS